MKRLLLSTVTSVFLLVLLTGLALSRTTIVFGNREV